MNYFKMKIKEVFINSIKNGTKKHEYRLATPERKNIRVGDILILVNKQNTQEYIKVRVTSIEFYSNWEEPLEKYWNEDFKDTYNNIQEVKEACYKFYTKEAVEECGIEVFGIEQIVPEIKGASVLLDTNIVIHRESSNNIAYEVIQLYKSLDNLKTRKCVIDDIKSEIKKYKDKAVVENMLAKLGSYNCLESREIDDIYFEETVSKYSFNENSQIDNKFLYQVYKGYVDFLVTDDKGILLKAKDLYISDVVLSTIDFLNFIEERYPSLLDYKALSVKLCKLTSIDINDPFFDTLREDYEGIKFNKWFDKKSKGGEKAYVFKNEEGIQGFLYLKTEGKNEDYSDIVPTFEKKKRLKIGTFKINSTGLRVGERFLKIIFDYAVKCNVDEIYVTLFEDKRNEVKALMDLMMKWGFEKHGYKKSNGELVMVKKMHVYRENKDPKFNYPNIKENPSFGILPIDAQFHTDLFPDLFLKNEDMTLFEEKPCGYAVEKIYVCSTKRIPLEPGDLMAIYRMSDRFYKKYNSVVSGICVLQEIVTPNTYEEYKKACTNRSVFTQEQLNYFYHEKDYKTVLKVLFLKPLDKKIILNDLFQNDIIKEEVGPRLTTTITKEKFDLLLKMGGIEIL